MPAFGGVRRGRGSGGRRWRSGGRDRRRRNRRRCRWRYGFTAQLGSCREYFPSMTQEDAEVLEILIG
jgi:hypothetical protein